MSNFIYTCDTCTYSTNLKKNYNIHMKSKRHEYIKENIEKYIYSCEICTKKFKCNSGMWRHSSKCVKPPELIDATEFKEQLNKISECLVDIKSNQVPTTNNNNITHNQQNINLFLNENCKNAKNFIDMINNIQLDTVYHDKISSPDYVATIFRMIKTEMDKIPIVERPIQCIKNEDALQEILHIRHDNEWRKETELEWTAQINNYYIDDETIPEEDCKIIFKGIKQMEDNIIEQIKKLYENTSKVIEKTREYKYEMDYVPNKMRIIKCLLEYIHMDRNELNRLIDEAYKQIINANV